MIVFQLVIKWKIKKFLNFRVSSLVKMADSDDSFDGEIERMNSEKEVNFQEVPSDILFTFKFKLKNGKTYRMTEYNLLRGKSLPYTVVSKGYLFHIKSKIIFIDFSADKIIQFSKSLRPDIKKMVLIAEKENFFTFQDSGQNTNISSNLVEIMFFFR